MPDPTREQFDAATRKVMETAPPGLSRDDFYKLVDQELSPAWKPGADSLSSVMTRPPQVISDTPEKEPDTYWGGVRKSLGDQVREIPGNLNAALQGPAHPQTLSDMAGLLLPGVGVEGAVAREMPGLLRGVRQAPARATGAAARSAEAVGRVDPSLTAQIGGWVGGGPGASVGAAVPKVSRGAANVLRRGEKILGGKGAAAAAEPYASTMPGGPRGGTTPAPPHRPILDQAPVPDSPNARGGTTPAPEYRPAPDVPDSPNATGSRVDYPERPYAEPAPAKSSTFDDLLASEIDAEMARPVVEPTGTLPPEPTMTRAGKPSVSAEGQAAAEGWEGHSVDTVPEPTGDPSFAAVGEEAGVNAARHTPTGPVTPDDAVHRALLEKLGGTGPDLPATPGADPNLVRRLSHEYGSKSAGQALGESPQTIKTIRGDSTSALPEGARRRIDAFLTSNPSPAEFRAWLAKGGNALSDSHITESLKRSGMADAEVADLMRRK
jgi:hypothetical protein